MFQLNIPLKNLLTVLYYPAISFKILFCSIVLTGKMLLIFFLINYIICQYQNDRHITNA